MRPSVDPSVLRSLQSIEQVMDASHEIQFPWQRLFAYGVLVGIIPFWERSTDFMCFGDVALKSQPMLVAAIHLVFYFVLFGVTKRLVRLGERPISAPAHPLISTGLRTQNVVLIAMSVAVLGLTDVGQADLIFPLCLLFFSVMFHEYAKYSRGPLMGLSVLSLGLAIVCFVAIKHWPVLEVWQAANTVWSLGFLGTALGMASSEKKHRA